MDTPVCVSSAKFAEPSSGLSDDFVDLLRQQRQFLQLRTPCHEESNPAPFRMLLIGFLHNLLDGCFQS